MPKLPFFQFYPLDWIRDTRCLPPEIRGVWIDILAIAWNEPKRGIYNRDQESLVRELGIKTEQVGMILDALKLVADVNLTEHNGRITVVSRRMVREEKEREINRKRQHRFRHNGEITDVKRQCHKEKSEVRSQKSDVNTPPIAPQRGAASKVREWFEKTWWAYPQERRVGKKAALKSYNRIVKCHEDALWVGRALDNYLRSQTVKDGFIKNASTFFANVEDYADERRNSTGPASEVAPGGSTPSLPGFGIDPTVKQVVARLGNPIPSGDTKDGILRK